MTVRVKFHRGSRIEAENMISKAEGDTYGALLILNLLCVCMCVHRRSVFTGKCSPWSCNVPRNAKEYFILLWLLYEAISYVIFELSLCLCSDDACSPEMFSA